MNYTYVVGEIKQHVIEQPKAKEINSRDPEN
jgi:hypothetical protein